MQRDVGVLGDHLLVEPLGLGTQGIGIALAEEEVVGILLVGLLDLLVEGLAVVADEATVDHLLTSAQLADGGGHLGLLLEILGQGQPGQSLGLAPLGGREEARQEDIAVRAEDVAQLEADPDGLGVVAVVTDEQCRGAGELVPIGPSVEPTGLVDHPDQGIAGGRVGGRRRGEVHHPSAERNIVGRHVRVRRILLARLAAFSRARARSSSRAWYSARIALSRSAIDGSGRAAGASGFAVRAPVGAGLAAGSSPPPARVAAPVAVRPSTIIPAHIRIP